MKKKTTKKKLRMWMPLPLTSVPTEESSSLLVISPTSSGTYRLTQGGYWNPKLSCKNQQVCFFFCLNPEYFFIIRRDHTVMSLILFQNLQDPILSIWWKILRIFIKPSIIKLIIWSPESFSLILLFLVYHVFSGSSLCHEPNSRECFSWKS